MAKLENFIAPPEIEVEIVDYCLAELKLTFGDFWYKWFDSNKEGNHTIHIDCDNPSLEELIKNTFPKLEFVDQIFKIQRCDYFKGESDFKFQYYIHFKRK